MQSLHDLGITIDTASDAGDVQLLRQLGEECCDRLKTAKGKDRVVLFYYWANTYGAIISSRQHNATDPWDWRQPDSIKNICLLRCAIKEPGFETIGATVSCQIRTNLALRLHQLGRPVAANEQYLKVLKSIPHFAKALANRGIAVSDYAEVLYDKGHRPILWRAAQNLFREALNEQALWESGDRNSVAPRLIEKCNQITVWLKDEKIFDQNQWSLGSTEKECRYRRWCLGERLFLNPLNDVYTDSIAATDVLHLPNHIYKISEKPRFPAYFNLLKQEYVSARYRLYCAIHEVYPEFPMCDVLLLDSGENQILGHHTEDLRSAFRSAYAIFDKIGLFLNDYYQLEREPHDIGFRRVWFEKGDQLWPIFEGHCNWLLRGLYFLSKDLFDASQEVAEPDAAELRQLRNQIEHRFVSFHQDPDENGNEILRQMSIDDFQKRTLHLLRIVREALIYVSLAMFCEESLRQQKLGNQDRHVANFRPRPITPFQCVEGNNQS